MNEQIKFVTIPKEKYADYRYEVIFNAYKWDPQVEDINTVADTVVILKKNLAEKLKHWAESLSKETMNVEEELINRKELYNELGLYRGIQKPLKKVKHYKRNRNIRLMRYDFHPTFDGFRISEVNSDVPGGLAEASILPDIAQKYLGKYKKFGDVAHSLYEAFKEQVKPGGIIAYVHATSYSDDRQVMQFISDDFERRGYKSILLAPDHIRWENNEAYSILEGYETKLDGIIRFFPLEWLNNLSRFTNWDGYYTTTTTSCNHPIAIFAQSKRLPLVWDKLESEVTTWKELLPHTINPKGMSLKQDKYIFKPTLGRVGEGISIKSVVKLNELKKIEKSVKRYPKAWIAQELFKSLPIKADNGKEYHLCIGVFTVQDKFAGFYGRVSSYPRIDAGAIDIPILVEED